MFTNKIITDIRDRKVRPEENRAVGKGNLNPCKEEATRQEVIEPWWKSDQQAREKLRERTTDKRRSLDPKRNDTIGYRSVHILKGY